MFEIVGKIVIYSVSGMLSIIIIAWIFGKLAFFTKSINNEYYIIRVLSSLLFTIFYFIIIELIIIYWKWLIL